MQPLLGLCVAVLGCLAHLPTNVIISPRVLVNYLLILITPFPTIIVLYSLPHVTSII